MLRQLPLGITLRDQTSLESFFAADNAQAVADIRACVSGNGEPYLYLWGSHGCGRSHLLQGACHLATEQQLQVAYVPLAEQQSLAPEILAGLGHYPLICLDDIDRVCGNPTWEQALFVLFNQLRDSGGRLLVSSDRGPAALPVRLADLASRLRWGVSYQIQPLDDQGRITVLQDAARRRGLQLPAETARFILRHAARDTGSLLQLLERLDRASLAAQRRLTVPFVRDFL